MQVWLPELTACLAVGAWRRRSAQDAVTIGDMSSRCGSVRRRRPSGRPQPVAVHSRPVRPRDRSGHELSGLTTCRRRGVPRRGCASSSPHGGRGLNITLPHKIAAVELAHELTRRAPRTPRRSTRSSMHDERHPRRQHRRRGPGARPVRQPAAGHDPPPAPHPRRRRRDARRAGAAAGDCDPAQIVIANRTPERAAALGRGLRRSGHDARRRLRRASRAEPFDLIINATSASLSGEIPPIPATRVGPQTVCYDLAYGTQRARSCDWAARPAARARCRAGDAGGAGGRVLPPVARRTPRHRAGAGGAQGARGST